MPSKRVTVNYEGNMGSVPLRKDNGKTLLVNTDITVNKVTGLRSLSEDFSDIMLNFDRSVSQEDRIESLNGNIVSHKITGKLYLRYHNKYLELHEIEGGAYINFKNNNDRINLKLKGVSYAVETYTEFDGTLTRTPHEKILDQRMHTPKGLDILEEIAHNLKLNKKWELKSGTIRESEYKDGNKVGSKIDLTFKFDYYKGEDFLDLPNIVWHENIKMNDAAGTKNWIFSDDMHKVNPNSQTFLSWREKYVEAYHYVRAQDKNRFNGFVKLKDVKGNEIKPRTFKKTSDRELQKEQVQNYLCKHGGRLEVTIFDTPGMRETGDKRERTIDFSIGFDKVNHGKPVVRFRQGTKIDPAKDQEISFVTISKNNGELASMEPNMQPPESVVKFKGKRSRRQAGARFNLH